MSMCNMQSYTLEKYFLVLYGLFCIEADTDKFRVDQRQIKEKLINEYKKGIPENGYNEKELDELLDIDVIKEWKPVLIHKAKYLSDEERVKYSNAVRLANKIIKEEVPYDNEVESPTNRFIRIRKTYLLSQLEEAEKEKNRKKVKEVINQLSELENLKEEKKQEQQNQKTKILSRIFKGDK